MSSEFPKIPDFHAVLIIIEDTPISRQAVACK
jgi:hypothetical protein